MTKRSFSPVAHVLGFNFLLLTALGGATKFALQLRTVVLTLPTASPPWLYFAKPFMPEYAFHAEDTQNV